MLFVVLSAPALGAEVQVYSARDNSEECRDIGTCEILHDVNYAAAKGEANAVTLTEEEAGVLRLRDEGAALKPGKGCTAVNANEVTCTVAENLDAVNLRLGNEDDTVTLVTTTFGVSVDAGPGSDTINGGAGDDSLDGDPGSDTIHGGEGDDALDGGTNPKEADVIDGGNGTDRVWYVNRKTPVFADLADSSPVAGEAGEKDSLISIDVLWGGDAADVLLGSEGPDEIEGFDGPDVIRGLAGNDKLTGDGGRDKLYGSTGSDLLYGYDGRDRLVGGCGRDTFEGGAGSDRIFARDGLRDFIRGGPLDRVKDRDFAAVDSGIDTVREVERLRKLSPPQAAC